MVVWQFTTIAALIGAVLIYVMVLTNRLGTTNALLKRIEEGLVRPQPVTENLPDRAVEVVPAPPPVPMERTAMEQTSVVAPVAAPARAAEMDVEEAPAAEVSERDRRVSYLTVRDLKVIAHSGRRSSDAPVGVSPLFNEVFGRKHGRIEMAESPAEQSSEAQEAHAAPQLEVVAVEEPMVASTESAAAVEELAMATYEIQNFLETTPSPAAAVTEHEPAAFEPTTTDPAPVEPAPAAPMATVFSEPAMASHIAAVVAEPALESHFTAEVAEPAVVPHPTAPLPELPSVSHLEAAVYAVEPSPPPPANPLDIVAANEDQPPAAAPAAAAAESEPGDAAAREEKRKRDLMMHAYRRRRSR
jgi:hypothetical protein